MRMQDCGARGHQVARFWSRRFRKLFQYGCFFAATFTCTYGQQDPLPATTPSSAGTSNGTGPVNSKTKMDKRAFGFVPNYKTADAVLPFQPLSPSQKMTIAAKDSFDWTLGLVAAGYAGLGQLTNQNRDLGQGLAGYGNRFARSYSDQVIGNMLVEGAMPILLHEDPRYFRRGQGTFWSRFGYAASRVFVTRTDSGDTRFNYSEVVGNSLAVGISNAYYPGSRNVGGNVQKFTFQLGTDAISNVLKEFWPDVKRKLPSQHASN